MVSLKNKRNGFTIVELLIVIVVIGILATLVLVTFNGIQQKGRDAKRKTDLGTIEQSLDTYYTDNNSYPTYAQLSSSSWVSTNLKGFSADALSDPKTGTTISSGTATAGTVDSYHYLVTGSDGTLTSPTTCANTDASPCVNFKVTSALEGDKTTVFSKQSNN